jgi:hypothetical protein
VSWLSYYFVVSFFFCFVYYLVFTVFLCSWIVNIYSFFYSIFTRTLNRLRQNNVVP